MFGNLLVRVKGLKFAVALFIILNIGIFIAATQRPVIWQHPENTYHDFFYSRDLTQVDSYTLHSGLHLNDFSKLLRPAHLEGGGQRFRPFARLVEMIAFKLWQSLGIVTFKNYGLIILHVFNALLLWLLLSRLTHNRLASLVATFLFLNSGIAFSTMLYPFQLMKPLLVTLFLLSWLCLPDDSGPVDCRRIALFFFIVLLELFTDEQAVFIFYIPALYLFWQRKGKLRLRAWLWGFGFTILFFIMFSWIFKIIAYRFDGPEQVNYFNKAASLFFQRLFQPGTYLDTLRSFIFYFLRRHCGYWDSTFWGLLSANLALGIFGFFLIVRKALGPTKQAGLFLVFLIIAKAALLGHLVIHPGIMPPATRFPSLLYFSYYYPYPDSLLLMLAFGLVLAPVLERNLKRTCLFLLAVSIFNLSHFAHIHQGIKGPIGLIHPRKDIDIYANILVLREQLATVKDGAVYLSFFSGRLSSFKFYMEKGAVIDPEWSVDKENGGEHRFFYDAIILVKFLRYLERGALIVSLDNVKSPYPALKDSELLRSKYFYDVPKRLLVDLAELRQRTGTASMRPAVVTQKMEGKVLVRSPLKNKRFIIFVKGAAEIIITFPGRTQSFKQVYGNSYQLFDVPVENIMVPGLIHCAIIPDERSSAIQVVGPFVF